MKENRKLLKEVLKEIRHDMTNEEVLNLLAVKAGIISKKDKDSKRSKTGKQRINSPQT